MSAGDEAGTVRVAVADMARLLATVEHWRLQVTDLQTCNTRTLERARDAERQLASEREQHSRLREQWEILSAELARTRTDRQRAAQVMKLCEECGEFIVATARDDARYQVDLVKHEIHDVLTVALSLCEPALMAASAERLEGRLP